MTVANMMVGGERDAGAGASVWAYSGNTYAWSYDTAGIVYKIVRDSSGNFYIVGQAADNGDGNGTRNLWKLDSEGNYLDGAYIASTSYAYDIAIDVNYIYVATGSGTHRLNHDLSGTTTIASGSIRQAVGVDTSGNIYVGGGGAPYTLTKYNSALVQQWYKDSNDQVLSIAFLANQDVIVGISDSEIRMYLADGTSPHAGSWAYVLTVGGSFVKALAVDSNDLIYTVASNTGPGPKVRIHILNSSGVEQWKQSTLADMEGMFINSSDRVFTAADYQKCWNIFRLDDTDENHYGQFLTPGRTILKTICASSDWNPAASELRIGIEGFWKLNDNAGNTTVLDESGNGYDGASSKNTSAMSAVGKINAALNFVKTDSDEVLFGNLGIFDFLANEDKTISFWYKWSEIDEGGDYETLIHKYDDSVIVRDGLVIRYNKTDPTKGSISAFVYVNGSPVMAITITPEATLASGWHLVTIRWDRGGNGFISIDNGLYTQVTDISSEEATEIVCTESVSFAGASNVTGAFVNFGGKLDCVSIWDKVISGEEEAEIWNSGNGTEDFGIHEVPIITDQPDSAIVNMGDTAVFSIVATGDPAPTYQWYLNGSPISGEVSSTLSFTVDANSGGDYTCVATNVEGSDTSDVAMLSIIPLITVQSSNTGVLLGQEFTLGVTAVGTPTLIYQWYKDGSPISGETGAILTLYGTIATAGTYTCVVTNDVGSDESTPIVLTVIDNPYIWNLFNLTLDAGRAD